jgi:hypothetical protein
MMVAIGSKREQISALLHFVCADLQLTDTQYDRATSAYDAISSWLSAPDSPVAEFDPDVYPQGSMAIGTTVRPRDGEEFDVDLVCSLNGLTGARPSRQAVLNIIAARMRTHGTYGPMVEIKDRCVRINYAGQFHADIVPGLPAPRAGDWGSTAIVIPCRKQEAWIPTNPLGYKGWFFSRCESPMLMEKRAAVAPFPKPVEEQNKASLQCLVQLGKRRRDVYFGAADSVAPTSILLTTVFGLHVGSERLLYDAAIATIDRIIGIYKVPLGHTPPVVENPSNPGENLARHWQEDRKHYNAFLEYADTYRAKLAELVRADGLEEIAELLKDLFDPDGRGIVKHAVERYTESFQGMRTSGQVAMAPNKSALTAATAAGALTIPGNTFFGS